MKLYSQISFVLSFVSFFGELYLFAQKPEFFEWHSKGATRQERFNSRDTGRCVGFRI
jgi:hypothetical protein